MQGRWEEILKIFSSPPFPLILRVNKIWGMEGWEMTVKYKVLLFHPFHLIFLNKEYENS